MLLSLLPLGRLCVWGVLTVTVAVGLTGCGGGESDTDATSATEGEGGEGGSETSDKPVTKKKTTKKKSLASAAPDVKRIDGIPYDVFFDNPRKVVSDNRSVGDAPPAAGNMAKTEPAKADAAKPADTPKPMTDTPKPAAGGGSWDKVASSEELLDAIKGVRNELDKRLGSVQAYNSAQLEVPVFGTELSMLAEIARGHAGEIRWKDKAKVIRTLGIEITKISSSAEARGKKSFDSINAAFSKVKELLDGNSPPDLPEAPDTVSFEENMNIKYLMKRLDRVESTLKTNTATEDGFGKNAAVAQREAVLATLLAQGIQEKTYGYDSEDDYLKQANGMRDAARGMIKAVADKNFTEYDTLRNQVSKCCSDCHMTYRTGK